MRRWAVRTVDILFVKYDIVLSQLQRHSDVTYYCMCDTDPKNQKAFVIGASERGTGRLRRHRTVYHTFSTAHNLACYCTAQMNPRSGFECRHRKDFIKCHEEPLKCLGGAQSQPSQALASFVKSKTKWLRQQALLWPASHDHSSARGSTMVLALGQPARA